MDLQELGLFLNQKTIPVTKNKIGFLEIIRKQHYENINSNIYAHFLSCDIAQVRSLFMDSLLSIISEKAAKHISFINEKVSTEVVTNKNGRIDILIEDYQSAILIENKIYHHLNNDLEDYWDYSQSDASKKIGVLLTLFQHEIPENAEGKFINITHIEWINKVKESFTPNFLPDNYKVYVDDFINTIEKLTRMNTMNQSAEFYFQHASQIIKASETLNEAHRFLNSELLLIANKIGWQSSGSELNWRYFWDENNNLDTYLTILIDNIVEPKEDQNMKFTLILELSKNDKQRIDKVIEEFKNHRQFYDKEPGISAGNYVQFLCKDYDITIDELANFSDVVVNKIKYDFAAITIDIIEYLYPDKDINTFKNQLLN
jgi:hypothetical protein